jgi:hypothetical protein
MAPVRRIDQPPSVGFELVPHLGLLVERVLELGWRRHRRLGRRRRRVRDRRLGRNGSVELRRLLEPMRLLEAVIVGRFFLIAHVAIRHRRVFDFGLAGPHRVASDRPQRIAFGAFDLGWIGAAPALEV